MINKRKKLITLYISVLYYISLISCKNLFQDQNKQKDELSDSNTVVIVDKEQTNPTIDSFF